MAAHVRTDSRRTVEVPTPPMDLPSAQGVFRELIAALDAPEAQREALCRAAFKVPRGRAVKTMFGHLMAGAVRDDHPALAEEAEAYLRRLGSRFSDTPIPVAVAYAAWLGQRANPDTRSLLEASNWLMEHTIVSQAESPFVQTFVRATGGNWRQMMRDFDTWKPLFTPTSESDARRIDERTMEVTIFGPEAEAMRYLGEGTFRGFMRVFGQLGVVEQTYVDGEVTHRVRW